MACGFLTRLQKSDLGIYDRVIVQDVIKAVAQSQQIDANAKHSFKGNVTYMLLGVLFLRFRTLKHTCPLRHSRRH